MSYVIQHSGIKGMKWGESKYVRKYKYGTDDPEGGLKSGETKTGNVGGWVYVYKGNPDTDSKNEESNEETNSESALDKLSKLKDSLFEKVDDLKDSASDKLTDIVEYISEKKYDTDISEKIDSIKNKLSDLKSNNEEKQYNSTKKESGFLGEIINKTSEMFEDVKNFVENSSKESSKSIENNESNRITARNAIRDDRNSIYEKNGEKEDTVNNKNYQTNMEYQFGTRKPITVDGGDYAKYLKDTNATETINGSLDDSNSWRTNNCAYCCVAADLTLRGYSVEALESNNGLSVRDISSMYKGFYPSSYHEYDFVNSNNTKTIDNMISDLSSQPSSYGIFCFYWSMDSNSSHDCEGGHAIMYSVNDKGSVSFYDPQVGEYMSQDDLSRSATSNNVKVNGKNSTSDRLRIMEYNDNDSRYYKGQRDYVITQCATIRTDNFDIDILNTSKICRSSSRSTSDEKTKIKVPASNYNATRRDKRKINNSDTYWTKGSNPSAQEQLDNAEYLLKTRYKK